MPADLHADTKRLHCPTLRGSRTVTELSAVVDGLGPGSGDQVMRLVAYDDAGALLGSTVEWTIVDGSPERRIVLPFTAGPVTLEPGCILGVQAGGADGSGRVHTLDGAVVATPVVNRARSPIPTGAANGAPAGQWSFAVDGGGGLSGAISTVADSAFDGGSARDRSAAWASADAGALLEGFYVSGVGVGGVAVVPLSTVRLGIAAKVVAATGFSSTEMHARARYRKADGTYLAEFRLAASAVANPVTGSVYWLEGTHSPPAGAALVDVMAAYSGQAAAGATAQLRVGQALVDTDTPTTAHGWGYAGTPGWTSDGTPDASSSRGPQGAVNRFRNPRVNSSVSCFGHNVGTVSFVSPGRGRYTASSPGNSRGTYFRDTASLSQLVQVDELKTYTAALLVDLTEPLASGVKCGIEFRDAAGTSLGNVNGPAQAAGVTGQAIIWFTRTAPADAAGISPTFYFTSVTGSESYDFLGGTIVEGTLPDLFSGADDGCDWTGDPDASPSIRWYLPELYDPYADGPAATTGLTPAGAHLPKGLMVFPLAPAEDRPTRVLIAPHRTRVGVAAHQTAAAIDPYGSAVAVEARPSTSTRIAPHDTHVSV